MLRALIVAGLFLGATAGAQTQNYTAHPVDNATSSTSQNIPFAGGTASWDEARSQFLFPAPFLAATPGLITGLELVPNTTYTTPYERFEIWMDHTANTTLSTNFASNLTQPRLVFSRTPGTIAWTGGAWTAITFDKPFIHDGTRNIVMEVRKKLDRPNNPTITAVSQRVLVYPRRIDLPPPIWAYGTYGSGAVDAATATTTYSTQILMRLQWGTLRTLTIDSTRATTSSSYFHLGSSANLTAQGQPAEAFLLFLEGVLTPNGLVIPPVSGRHWLFPRFLMIHAGVLDAAGRGMAGIPIPNDPGLVGLRAYFQAITVGTAFTWTNVVDAPIALT